MLDTNLKHIESKDTFDSVLAENENVMICCGRMGPMCLPVYDVMEQLEPTYTHVAFRDMPFDSQVAMETIRTLPQTLGFTGLPFVVYFRNGQVVHATSSIQNRQQVTAVLDEKLAAKAA
jgi:thioredoxin 1